MEKDYYSTLGVEKSASREDIKKAYHKLARKYHPDNRESGNEQKFKEINEAYQMLSDEKRRAEYDSYGHVFGGGASDFGGFSSPFGGFSGYQDFDFGDIFSEFFGGVGTKTRVPRGRDISIDLELSFQDAVYGTERRVLLAKTALCETCKGSGAEHKTEFVICKTCNGQGRIHETRNSFLGTISSVRECSTCRGQKKIPKEKCRPCHGLGVIKRQEEVAIKIPHGIENGEVIRISGLGEAVSQGVPGDLYVKIHVGKHDVFRRDGKDLVMNLDIKLTDALLGSEYTIKTLDGASLKIKIPETVSFGETLRLKGKGIPLAGGRRGDLLIKLTIKLPKHLSHKSRKLFEDLRGEGI